jgi:TadE-like protein
MRTRGGERGQSLVEFGVVVPILLMLAVAVGDFGRIFATGVIVESAARNAAELGANEYLADWPGRTASPPISLSSPAPTGETTYYTRLHQLIAKAVCAETQELPNATFDPGTGSCAGMPYVMSCIHDGQDTNCGTEAFGAAVPSSCTEMSPAASDQHSGSPAPRWVEVRVCYRFTSVVAVPLVSFGEFWVQRTRRFVIPCYFALGTAQECG